MLVACQRPPPSLIEAVRSGERTGVDAASRGPRSELLPSGGETRRRGEDLHIVVLYIVCNGSWEAI